MGSGRKEESERERERRNAPTLYDRSNNSTETYWLLFLIRAKEGAEFAWGGHKTRQLSLDAGKVNEPLHIPSVPFDYNFGNVWLFDSRLLLKF